MADIQPDAGSFRDPLSRVYLTDDRVLRALTGVAAADYDKVKGSRFFRQATGSGQVIATTELEEAPTDLGLPDQWKAVLEHPKLGVWTYPYEWSFSMLQDAAKLQLELLRDALEEDLTCKDASSYNIQFEGAKPIFIDVGSFEPLQPGDPWYGYLQFCQLYLYPLLFQAYADLPFHPLLRGSINGISPEEAARVLGPLRLPRKGVLIHVALHARAQQRFADADTDVKASLKKSGFKKELIQANVKGLLRLVENLQWKRSESTWSEYTERGHYADRELKAKEDFVREVAAQKHRRMIWDVGCNDGHFSRLVSGESDWVLALDSDHLVVDTLYRRLREEPKGNIVPLVCDLADPAPGLGWRGRERAPFLERNRPDLMLCLAVIHHVAITSNVPISEFLDLLVDLGCESVVEFPTEDDPMVKRLLRNKREGVHDDYTLAAFEKQVDQRFTVERRLELDSKTRVLFHLTPR